MRQIIIYILTALVVAAAPNNREQINKQLNESIIPKIGNLNGFTIEEMITVLYKNSNKINFLYFLYVYLILKFFETFFFC